SAAAQPEPGEDDDTPGQTETARLAGKRIERVQFRGNRKVEDDAIRVHLATKPGSVLDATRLGSDIRAMWRLGFFEEIEAEAEPSPTGGVIVTFAVKEKPSVRKVLISGNKEVGLDKINEVLDLKRDTILDIAKVKQNQDKVR